MGNTIKEKVKPSAVAEKKTPLCRLLSPEEKKRLFNLYIYPKYDFVKSLTKHYTKNPQDVDENFNLCLAQLYNYIGSYDTTQKLDTWIHISVKRACQYENKKRAIESDERTDIEMCSYDDLYREDSPLVVHEERGSLLENISDEVYAALLQISPQCLSPLMMYVQGMRIREITAVEWELGHLPKRSEGIVKARIFWTRKKLQFILRKYGITKTNY